MMRRRKHDNSDGNTGVQNSGFMQNVQNQPGAVGSVQSQGTGAPDPQTLQQITEGLSRLMQQVAADRGQIPEADQCLTLLDVAAAQPLDQPEGRATATALLTRVRNLCQGANKAVGLAASIITLLTVV